MSIVDAQGEVVAEYEYDPYGNILTATGPLADVNPLRYRGYVFDSETQFYYLQSRYYDPELGRFINADAYCSTGQGVLGNNMFAYCGNNPIMRCDPFGENPLIALAYAAVGALINIGASYIAAKVTGQSFTFTDGLVAAGVGIACSFGSVGTLLGGILSCGYSAYSSRQNGASVFGMCLVGLVSFVFTAGGIGNIAGLDHTWANLGIQAFVDFIFGTGYNSMSAGVYKAVVISSQKNENNLTANERNSSLLAGIDRLGVEIGRLLNRTDTGSSAVGSVCFGSQKSCFTTK